MTVFTNKFNAPIEVVRSLQNDPYHKGEGVDISATEMITSPRIRMLRKKHEDEMVVDVSEQIWSLLGQSVHTILERANENETDVRTEERMYAQVGSWKISGQYDSLSLENKTLRDYKVTSVWSVVNAMKEGKEEWDQQLNTLAWLYQATYGEPIESLEIIAICRDWNKRQFQRSYDGSYPPSPCATIPIRLWSLEEQSEYIFDRVGLHQSVEHLFTNSSLDQEILPSCNAKERWAKQTKWAVMKKGRKSAIKLMDSEVDAELRVEYEDKNNTNQYYVEERKGESTRCVGNYCGVAQFCDQYKKERVDD